MKPEVSVIVVTTETSLGDILSLQKLREYGEIPFETVVRTDEGICRARNQGIESASTDKLVFLDDDAVPANGYLRAVSDALDEHAVVTGPVNHPDTLFSEFADHYQDPETLVGCNMAFRREVFEQIGFFDENLNWGHDETELANRLEGEFDIHYDSRVCVKHEYAESISDYLRKMWRFGPADLYYGRKVGTGSKDGEGDGVLSTLLGPDQFLSKTVRGTLVKSTGRLVRNASIGIALVGELRPGFAFQNPTSTKRSRR